MNSNNKWLPIASAPFGSVVLLCDKCGNRWTDVSPGDAWERNGCGYPPVVWQELPPPPTYPASGDELLATRDAWFAVCDALAQVDPDWMMHGPVGVEAAVATIRRLATHEQPEIAGVRDTLIVAANNPVSHGGLNGLQQIMRAQAERLRNIEQPGSSVQGEATCHPNEIAALRKIFPEATTSALVDGIFAIKWATTPPPAPLPNVEEGDFDCPKAAASRSCQCEFCIALRRKTPAAEQGEVCMTEGDKITAQNEAFDIAESMQPEARGVEGTREAFERWVSKRHGYATDRWADSGQYQYDNTRAMWACWQNGFAAAPAAPGVRVDERDNDDLDDAAFAAALTANLATGGGEGESNAP